MCNWTGKAATAAFLLMITLPGCVRGPCGRGRSVRSFTGTALDAESMQPVGAATIEIQSFTDGEENAHGSTEGFRGQPPTPEDAAFEVAVLSDFAAGVCGGLFPTRLPELALPDEILVTVTLDGCEQELTIAINDDTSTQVIEDGEVTEIQLLDPILVPPCPPPTDETAELESTGPTQ